MLWTPVDTFLVHLYKVEGDYSTNFGIHVGVRVRSHTLVKFRSELMSGTIRDRIM